MNLLTLVRHAKSSWDDPSTQDFDRVLNKRGLGDAPTMAARLKLRGCIPDLIVSSPAQRALQTARLLATGLGHDVNAIKLEKNLYEATTGAVMDLIAGFDDAKSHVMVVGHNPSFENLMALLNGTPLSVPTCAVGHFSIDCKRWQEFETASIALGFHDYPKNTTPDHNPAR